MLFSFRTRCLSFPFVVTHRKKCLLSEIPLLFLFCFYSGIQNQKKMIHRECFVSLSLWKNCIASRQRNSWQWLLVGLLLSLIKVSLSSGWAQKTGTGKTHIGLLYRNWTMFSTSFTGHFAQHVGEHRGRTISVQSAQSSYGANIPVTASEWKLASGWLVQHI